MLTVYSSCKLKTWQDERQGNKLPLEAIAFYSDSFVAQKVNVEQKRAENWAPSCTANEHHSVAFRLNKHRFIGCYDMIN